MFDGMSREPRIHRVRIADLHPTQITIGLREVAAKRATWRAMSARDRIKFLDAHIVPVVQGPRRAYLIDHHHLARALKEEGHDHVWALERADFSRCGEAEFWSLMDHRAWVHPYDADGLRQAMDAIPRKISKLVDDPYRSVAAEVRERGGFAKESAPFEEFQWADFFRRRIPARLVKKDFDGALRDALALAHDPVAQHLPGWAGASK
jgi:hypothetical protein